MGTIFGVGPLEVLVILVLVLLVFGPERLPELTRNLGTGIRKLRETYVAFVTEFREELTPIATEIDAVTRDLRNDLAAIRDAADIRGLIPTIDSTDIGAIAPKPEEKPAELPPPPPLEKVPEPPKAELLPVVLPSSITGETAKPTTYTNGSTGKPMLGSTYQYANGSTGHSVSYGTPEQVATNPPVKLEVDNPWASIGAPVRSDQLDEDNPWRQ